MQRGDDFMAEKMIHITEQDRKRLLVMMDEVIMYRHGKARHLLDLISELNRAKIVVAQDVPPDVITMNSKVKLLDLDTQEETIYTLVYPQDSNVDQGKISVLTPIGTALLGYSLGDIIEWPTPGGVRRLKVQELLYQPEKAGDYNL